MKEVELTITEVEELVARAFELSVSDEDNSWRCRHNLEVLLGQIRDLYKITTGN